MATEPEAGAGAGAGAAPAGAARQAPLQSVGPVAGPPALRIGPVCVRPGILLAPMEDLTDSPFRLICKRLGAALVYTEFTNAQGLVRDDPARPGRALGKLRFAAEERPLGIQLYGADARAMARAAEIAAAVGPDLLDVNCGCWVRSVALQGAGAGLLRDPAAMRAVVASVVRATSLPVTVKTRLGWDAASIRILDVARMLEDAGIQGLTVHCRTRAQGNSGPVDWSWIARLREVVRIPVILNGGLAEAADVARAYATTGCSGVMIGRGAVQHPWIFREAGSLLLDGIAPPPPSMVERVDLCLAHLGLAVAHGGERYALVSLRRHYAGYFRHLRGAAALRRELADCGHVDAVIAALHRLRERALREGPDAAAC